MPVTICCPSGGSTLKYPIRTHLRKQSTLFESHQNPVQQIAKAIFFNPSDNAHGCTINGSIACWRRVAVPGGCRTAGLVSVQQSPLVSDHCRGHCIAGTTSQVASIRARPEPRQRLGDDRRGDPEYRTVSVCHDATQALASSRRTVVLSSRLCNRAASERSGKLGDQSWGTRGWCVDCASREPNDSHARKYRFVHTMPTGLLSRHPDRTMERHFVGALWPGYFRQEGRILSSSDRRNSWDNCSTLGDVSARNSWDNCSTMGEVTARNSWDNCSTLGNCFCARRYWVRRDRS